MILQILARCGAFFIGFIVKGQMNHDFAFGIEVNPCVIEITIGNTTSPKKIAMYSAKIVGVKKTIVEGVSRLNLSLMFSNFIGNVRSKLVNLTSWKR